MPDAPSFPAGEFVEGSAYHLDTRQQLTTQLREAPGNLKNALDGLSDSQLDTPYRNWTIRQITHHIADSHVNSYIRFKWALTESTPVIKAYDEGAWVKLNDCEQGDVGPALALVTGLHDKWVQLIESMSEDQFASDFVHPETNEIVSLWTALNYYPWHSLHHTAQILWLRTQNTWI